MTCSHKVKGLSMSTPPGEKRITFLDTESGAEMVRQIRQEKLVTHVMQGLFPERVDLAGVRRVLDVYCGPGGWTLELAFQAPEIDVLGIDKSGTMIDYAHVQANVLGLENASFMTMDPTDLRAFPANIFDVVNARFMAFHLTKADWPRTVQELVRVTQPGGLVFLTESDGPGGTSNSRAHETLQQLSLAALARNAQSYAPNESIPGLTITPLLRHFLQDAGVHHVQEKASVLNYSAGTSVTASVYENYKIVYKLGQPFLVAHRVATQPYLDELYEQMLVEMLADDFCGVQYFLTAWGRKRS